ncbi:hypothetical protein LAZ67_15002817 [Cordylochernes scorpioides]|uniref:Reverse transcriptase domain-containing protein n=1 Tax=Cordylochernes scorpioides TaxID=51811 RepID=A0ABY6LCF8_9ARAC|nr:hypothetical protein LAZ67_15002817 [Cordylochernes scorpioides]
MSPKLNTLNRNLHSLCSCDAGFRIPKTAKRTTRLTLKWCLNSSSIPISPGSSRIPTKYKTIKLDLKTAKTLLETFLNFNYIEFKNKIYIQSEGFPMGTSSSPLLANLILFWYEREYFLQNNVNWQMFRYVDDIIIFNNPQFKKLIPEIYPKYLKLKNNEKIYRNKKLTF